MLRGLTTLGGSRANLPRGGTGYALLALGALGLGLAGYAGFVLYPSFDLPAGVGAGLLLLAAAAGVASFFSPCSFPLLVSMLARPVAERREGEGHRQPTKDALTFATALSLGVVTFLLAAGTLIAVGGDALFDGVAFTSATGRSFRVAVGVLMVFLALIQLNRLRISLRRFEPITHGFLRRQRREGRVRRQRPFLRFTAFGFVYLVAGIGCTGPILAGLAAQSFVLGGFDAALAAFAVAAAVIVALMFTLALTVASAQERVVGAMRSSAPAVKRWGGRILLVLGLWFIGLGVFADFFADVFPV